MPDKAKHVKPGYRRYGNIWVRTDTDPKFAQFLADAEANRKRIMITYNKGWEDFSGYRNKNGLTHRCYVGKSTGKIKIPLVIHRVDSTGGAGMTTCRKAVKSWKYI